MGDFFRIFGLIFFKLTGARSRGALPLVGVCWGVTAGKSSHTASNARDVTAGKMGRNSSICNVLCTFVLYITRWLPGFARVPNYAPSPCHMHLVNNNY